MLLCSKVEMAVLKMKFIQKIKTYFQTKSLGPASNVPELTLRLDRLERNYVVLLKRVLELDGIQLKINAFSSKILHTNSDEPTNSTIH